MENLTQSERDNELASVMFHSIEVSKTPITQYDVAIKSYVDLQVNNAIISSTQQVTDLIANAPAAMNTLVELSNALLNNPNIGSVLTTQISNVASSVTQEAVARSEAIGVVNTFTASLQEQINFNDSALTQEVSNRNVAIGQAVSSMSETTTSLQDQVNYEITARAQAISEAVSNAVNVISITTNGLSQDIHNEESERRLDVVTLQNNINQESADSQNRNSSLASSFNNEVQLRNDEKFATDSFLGNLAMNKFDISPNNYVGGSEQPFKVLSYLYIGDNWRICAGAGNNKRLEFQYSENGLEPFKVAVPFIRAPVGLSQNNP